MRWIAFEFLDSFVSLTFVRECVCVRENEIAKLYIYIYDIVSTCLFTRVNLFHKPHILNSSSSAFLETDA